MGRGDRRSVLAVGAVALLVAGGCSSPGGVPAGVTAEQFRAAADQRCAQTLQQLDEVAYPDDADVTLQSMAPSFAEVAAINRSQIEDLRALDHPEADRERIRSLLEAAATAIDHVDAMAAAAEVGDQEGYDAALTRFTDASYGTYEQARSYGFETCYALPEQNG